MPSRRKASSRARSGPKRKAAAPGGKRASVARTRTPSRRGSTSSATRRKVPASGRAQPKRAATERTRVGFARTFRNRDRITDEIRGNLKRGPVRIATTRQVTPTKRGFKALERQLAEVSRANRVRKAKPEAYSYRVEVSYRTPAGKRRRVTLGPGGFPTKGAVRKSRKKGETEAAAFKRVTTTTIRDATFRGIDQAEGISRYGTREREIMAKGSPKTVQRMLRGYRERRGVKVKVIIEKEIT